MSDAVLIALFAGLSPTLVAVTGLVVALRTKSNVQSLHIDVNHRIDQLVQAEKQLSRTEGILVGATVPLTPPLPVQP